MSNRIQDVSADQIAHLVLIREIEDFLYREADLLDERDYDQWLDLLADDIRYWMPLRLNVPYEDRAHDMTAEEDDVAVRRRRAPVLGTAFRWRRCHAIRALSRPSTTAA